MKKVILLTIHCSHDLTLFPHSKDGEDWVNNPVMGDVEDVVVMEVDDLDGMVVIADDVIVVLVS